MPYIRELSTATSNTRPLWSPEDPGCPLLGDCRHQDMVMSYSQQHNQAGRLISKEITKCTSGNNVFVADLSTGQTTQETGVLNAQLPPCLAHGRTNSGQEGGARSSTGDSLGTAVPEDQLKAKPDIMKEELNPYL